MPQCKIFETQKHNDSVFYKILQLVQNRAYLQILKQMKQ